MAHGLEQQRANHMTRGGRRLSFDQWSQSEIFGKETEQLLSPNLSPIHFLAPIIEVHDICSL
jgi:hypothetical protein